MMTLIFACVNRKTYFPFLHSFLHSVHFGIYSSPRVVHFMNTPVHLLNTRVGNIVAKSNKYGISAIGMVLALIVVR